MAALSTDLLKKVARRLVGQIGSGGVADATTTTVPLSSATNFPTDTAVVATIDRVDTAGTATASLEETVIGIISGSSLISCTRGVEGTAQAHSAGAVVEILVTAKGWNDLIDHLLTQHNQLGTHTNITASNIQASGNYKMLAGVALLDANANELLKFTQNASAVNEFTVANAITASEVILSVTGGDTNAGMKLLAKGTGQIQLGSGHYQPFQTYTPAAAGTATLDLSLGNVHNITMPAGNITIALSNEKVGQKFIVNITQDGTGSRTVTWFTTIRWFGGSAPTLTTTASKRDALGFVVTGAGTYDGVVVGQNA